jgi:hypothetical protein
MWPALDPCGQRGDERTTLQLSGVASPNGVGQDALHGGEVGNLRSHVGQVSRRDLAHLSADTVAMRVRQPEQGAHLLQCEAQLARPAHEYQAPNLLRTIASIAPVPARVRQDPDALVVADGFRNQTLDAKGDAEAAKTVRSEYRCQGLGRTDLHER